jgi:hypothetical protein
MPSSLNSTVSAREEGYNVVQVLGPKKVLFSDNGTTLTIGKLPPYSHVVGGGVHVVTAFNDSGTDVLDVGFIGGTTDADAYATQLTLAAVGMIVLDELAATTNIMQTVDTTVTCLYSGQNSNMTAGEAYVWVYFVTQYPRA